MFKKVIVATVIGLMILGVTTKAQAADKIALVSLQRALNEVNDGKKAKEGLKKEYEVKKKQIDDLKTGLEKMSQELESQKMVLSADALGAKKKELQTKLLDLQTKAATFEKELATKESESAKNILTKLRQIVMDLSKKEGYTLVIENTAETVLFSANGEDITPKVISAYNAGGAK